MLNFKRYPLSTICIIVIWVLSLLPIFPETPLDDVAFIDKWTHLVMYGGTALVIWHEYYWSHHKAAPQQPVHIPFRLLLIVTLALALMGGLLELLQAYCTGGHRSGEWLDFAADTVGAILGTLAGYLLTRIMSHIAT